MHTPSRALLAVAAVALVVAACGEGATEPDGEPEGTTTVPPTAPAGVSSTTSSEPPSTVSSTTPTTSNVAADELYTITFSARGTGVIALSVADGSIHREVTSAIGEGAGSLEFSPSRDSLLYSRAVTAARSEIVEVPISGDGEPTVVTTGYDVGIADRAERLAVARVELVEGGAQRTVLELRDFDGEILGVWFEDHSAEEPIRVRHLAWSPDGSSVAFELSIEDGSTVYVLDPDSDGRTIREAATPVPNPGENEGAMRSTPFWLDDQRLGVVEGCCELPTFETWRLIVVDPSTGSPIETLFSLDVPPSEVDVQEGGDAVAVITGHDALGAPGGATPPQLAVWDPVHGLRTLGKEHLSVAW